MVLYADFGEHEHCFSPVSSLLVFVLRVFELKVMIRYGGSIVISLIPCSVYLLPSDR